MGHPHKQSLEITHSSAGSSPTLAIGAPNHGTPLSMAEPTPGEGLSSDPYFCPFGLVPKEIFDAIAGFLPPPSRIFLGLTCKGLYEWSFVGGVPKLDYGETGTLLVGLERDLKRRFVCFDCRKLHSFDPLAGEAWRGQAEPASYDWIASLSHGCPPQDKKFQILSFAPKGLNVTGASSLPTEFEWVPNPLSNPVAFSVAHLIMNRHRYGLEHGIPITALDRHEKSSRLVLLTTDPTYPPESALCEFSFDQNAEIIDGELFLFRRHRVTGPAHPSLREKGLVGIMGLPICAHIRPWDLDDLIQRRRRESAPSGSQPSTPEGFSMNISCTFCCTDCAVSFRKGADDDGGEFSVQLLTYHYFGACQTLDSPFLFFLRLPISEHRRRLLPAWGAGTVRRAFLKRQGYAYADQGDGEGSFRWDPKGHLRRRRPCRRDDP
ncbi:hypothetical protein HJFPF1_05173 [Paramyrothecium foliicola]|nr:hypothetical protein HJFPF1_05173 [Paramyrothecium foliicola]